MSPVPNDDWGVHVQKSGTDRGLYAVTSTESTKSSRKYSHMCRGSTLEHSLHTAFY